MILTDTERIAQLRTNWRRFVWRLVALSLVTGGLVLGIGFARNNAVLTMLGAFFLANAVWMSLWTVVEDAN